MPKKTYHSKQILPFAPHARLFLSNIHDEALLPPITPAINTRKNADDITPDEQMRFKDVIAKAIADGIYSRLVSIHGDMTHDMHTMLGMPAGTLRFLSWHRVYLVKFEQAMRAFDPNFVVPYWRWMDASIIPAWMASFEPMGVVDRNGKPIPVMRATGTNPEFPALPTSQTIQTTVFAKQNYQSFTIALEGATRPVTAHNLVHMWFNGTMSEIPKAPADPMFWMLHAEIDRLWTVWEHQHPGQIPNLSGAAAILDPWPETVTDVLDTTKVPEYPYTYDLMNL